MGKRVSSPAAELLPGFEDSERVEARPFLKWVGGKSQLLPELLRRIPRDIDRYFEPFIGGGALLFALQPRRAVISDVNPELINAYSVVRDDVEKLIRELAKHRYESDYYYAIRNADRDRSFRRWSAVRRAGRLIYLNKTCYNGLYRVNAEGEFNTPFGRYVNPTIVDADNLRACSRVLQRIAIKRAGFAEALGRIGRDDFVYFDPPYVPLSATSSFTGYARAGFDEEMQEQLFQLCCRLDRRKVRFMLSNPAAPWVIERYSRFKVEKIMAARHINSKADGRSRIAEVLVTNFDPNL